MTIKDGIIPTGAAFQAKGGISRSTESADREISTSPESPDANLRHPKLIFFTQSGCFSCELMRIFLEANEADFEEHDISDNPDARRDMLEQYGSHETPTLVFFFSDPNAVAASEVITGFNPTRLDQLLHQASSSSSVTEA